MDYRLVWTIEARTSLAQLVSYLDELHPSAGDQLLIQVDKSLSLISGMPFMYAVIPEKTGVRRCVLDRYTVLCYRIGEAQVELLSFFDSRQDPAKRSI